MPKDATAVPGFELGTSSMEVHGLVHTVRLDRSATTGVIRVFGYKYMVAHKKTERNTSNPTLYGCNNWYQRVG